jgi:hypothetical protein
MFGRFHLQSKSFQAELFRFIIRQVNGKSEMIHRGMRRTDALIIRITGSNEQGHDLCVIAVPFCNTEEGRLDEPLL